MSPQTGSIDPDTILLAALEVAGSTDDPDEREDALHWLADRLHEFQAQGDDEGGEQ